MPNPYVPKWCAMVISREEKLHKSFTFISLYLFLFFSIPQKIHRQMLRNMARSPMRQTAAQDFYCSGRLYAAPELAGDVFLPDFCLFFCGSNPYHTVPKDFLENRRPARNLRSGRALECLKLGAGVGFEPTTFRL